MRGMSPGCCVIELNIPEWKYFVLTVLLITVTALESISSELVFILLCLLEGMMRFSLMGLSSFPVDWRIFGTQSTLNVTARELEA